ncbi:MAG: fibronectin type III domain-containing protein [Thermoguttaceae bacterium]|nr:fibronectin type III domain-containing protein [Thermoguttaceae bacterium]
MKRGFRIFSKFQSRKSRKNRPVRKMCRVESLESRNLLSAVPFTAPDYASMADQYASDAFAHAMESVNEAVQGLDCDHLDTVKSIVSEVTQGVSEIVDKAINRASASEIRASADEMVDSILAHIFNKNEDSSPETDEETKTPAENEEDKIPESGEETKDSEITADDDLEDSLLDEISGDIVDYTNSWNDENQGETGDENQGETGDENQGETSDENQGETGDENQGETGDENQGETGDENQGETGDENQGETGDENQGETGDENQGETGDENQGETGDENQGETGDENQGETGDENQGETGDENEEEVSALKIESFFSGVKVSWEDAEGTTDQIRYRETGTDRWIKINLPGWMKSFPIFGKVGATYEVEVVLDTAEGQQVLSTNASFLEMPILTLDRSTLNSDSFGIQVKNYSTHLSRAANEMSVTLNDETVNIPLKEQKGTAELSNGVKVEFENGNLRFSGLEEKTRYTVRVSFSNGLTSSIVPGTLTVVTAKASSVQETPENIQLSTPSITAVFSSKRGSATVMWLEKANVSNYELAYRESGTEEWTTVSAASDKYVTQHTISGLESGVKYEFRLRAVSADLSSGWSGIKTLYRVL